MPAPKQGRDTMKADDLPLPAPGSDDMARTAGEFNFAYLDEQTKRMIRRAILKAVAIPEHPLSEGQVIVFQVPVPEPMQRLEPREQETRAFHALEEYGLMYVKLYEDIARFGHIATTYDYPVLVNDRYVMSPSPIPKFDNPKLDMNPALMLFGAGREKRIYAVPPYTKVESLGFEDHPFSVQRWDARCALCGASDSYLDEVITDDAGTRMHVCSDSDYCQSRLNADAGSVAGASDA